MRRFQRHLPIIIGLLLTGTSAAFAQSTHEAIERVLPTMVKIYGAGGFKNLETYGTGFVISADGYIATVWGHILDAEYITVVLDDGRRFEAELIGAEPRLELAVLKVDAEALPFIDLTKPAESGTGSRVLGFSNMYGVAAGDEPVSVLHGVITATTRLELRRGRSSIAYDGPVYLVDAITNNSGAAGGLLTTRTGRPLAMIGRQLRSAESNLWLNYAIPLGELAPVVRQIQTGDFSQPKEQQGDDRRDRFRPHDFGIVMVPNVVPRTPAYIDAIQPDSPAAKVDLQPDDLIVFANDRLVQSVQSLRDELGKLQPADDLTLVVRRGDSLVTLTMRTPRTPRRSGR